MTEKVIWRVNGIYEANAQKVAEEIGDGKFDYKDIVEKARDESTELHKCFEWDDTKAAEKYRLQQARNVVQMLVFTPTKKEEQPLRVFQITQDKNVYQPTKLFLQNKSEYEALLERALRELEAFKKRYSTLAELEEVFDAIEKAL